MGKFTNAMESVADNVVGLARAPGQQFKKAAGVVVDAMKSDGMVGAAANTLDSRKSSVDAEVDKAMGKDMGEVGKKWDESFEK